MNKLSSVIRFTFMNRFRTKSFRVTTIILAVIMTLLFNLPAIIHSLAPADEPVRLGIIGPETEVARALKTYYDNQENPDLTIVMLGDAGSEAANKQLGKEKLNAKEIKGYIEFIPDPAAAFPKVIYNTKNSLDFTAVQAIKSTLETIKFQQAVQRIGVSADQMAELSAPVVIETVQVKEGTSGKSEAQMAVAYGLVYILLFLIYMTVIGYGNMVAMEITSEKSSRVMEVLISSASPLKQMFGKIIGICLLGLVQIGIFAIVAILNISLPQNRDLIQGLGINLGDIELSLIGYFVIFYFLGYFIYATIFAAIGSLVSRTEEVGQAIMPAMFLIIAGFMIAMFGLQNPNTSFVAAMSYVPFFSPLIMFLRIGLSDPSWWEIWLSIAITAASALALGWLSAKIYRVGVLMYGKRPSFKELLKAMKAFKM